MLQASPKHPETKATPYAVLGASVADFWSAIAGGVPAVSTSRTHQFRQHWYWVRGRTLADNMPKTR